MTGTALAYNWYTTRTRKEIYEDIVLVVKEFHIMTGKSEDKATRLANIHAVKNTNKEFYRRLNERI